MQPPEPIHNSMIKFHKLARQLDRQNETSILNHLLSILNVDYPFVSQVFEFYSSYPKIANLRCGIWYYDHFDATCYFKSTDGHSHFINFSLQRLNMHVALMAAEKGAVLIVDSTRKGKRFPDSFNKTIPIWCCVLNNALNRFAVQNNLPIKFADAELHLSTMVSSMEKDEIAQKVDFFVEKLLQSGIELQKLYQTLQKPLRCLWIGTQSKDFPSLLDQLSFTPIICVSASDPEYPIKSNSWHYIQGAGDDQESWCLGLTPSLFYANHSKLLQVHEEEECRQRVLEIVQANSQTNLQKHQIQQASSAAAASLRSKECIQIGNIPIWIGISSQQELIDQSNSFEQLMQISWIQKAIEQFDAIVICCCKEVQILSSSSKKVMKTVVKDSAKYRKSVEQEMNSILKFVKPFLYQSNSSIAIVCSTGNNESIAVAIGILTYFFSSQGDHSLIPMDQLSSHASQLQKQDTTKQLVFIQSFIESGIPSKALLKQINRVFLS